MHDLPLTPANLANRWLDFWFRIDLRSLGLFRILISVVLLWHLIQRWPWIDILYTHNGVLPADQLLRGGDWLVQLVELFTWYANPLIWLDPWPWAIRLCFVATAASYVMLLIGYRTRLATLLSLMFFAWISHRNRHLMIGADYVLGSLLLWSLLLPLEARFSLDAIIRRMRQGVTLPSAASDDSGMPRLAAPETSPRMLPALAVVLQIGLVYFCTAWLKQGPTWWRDGTAVYYALYLEQSIFTPALWVRQWPIEVLQWLTWGTLAIEFAALPLLLIPVCQPLLRRLCLLGLIGLHIGIALVLDVGLFSHTMIASYALLLRAPDWELLRRWLAPLSRPATIYYDDSCGICHRCCQLLAIGDRFGKLSFIGNSDLTNYRHNIPEGLTEKTVVVVDDRTGRQYIKAQAAAAAFRGLPLPFRLWCWIGWPGFRIIGNAAYDAFARNRHRVSQLLGMTACGVPLQLRPDAAASGKPSTGQGAGAQGELGLRPPSRFQTAVAAVLLVGMLVDCVYFTWIADTKPALTDPRKDPTLARFITAPYRLAGTLQRWNMFSPDASAYDLWWVVEVETADGKRLNAFNPRQPVTYRQPTIYERPFDTVMGEYLKHGLYVEGSYTSPESEIVARLLLQYVARQLQNKWSSVEPKTVRIYRMLAQAPNPLEPDADRARNILKVGEYDIASGEFQGAQRMAFTQMFRPDGTRSREGWVDWATLLPQGRWLVYRPDGTTLSSIVTLRDGVVDGPATAWDDNNLRMEGNMRNENYEGYWRIYHPDGWKYSAGRYRNGKRQGVWEKYYPGGGRQRQVTFVDDVEHGLSMTWHPNGQPWERGEFRNGKRHGLWTEWTADGALASRGEYVDGQRHGTWTIWKPIADAAGSPGMAVQIQYEHGKPIPVTPAAKAAGKRAGG